MMTFISLGKLFAVVIASVKFLEVIQDFYGDGSSQNNYHKFCRADAKPCYKENKHKT